MKTVEEINKQLAEKAREYKELDDIYTFTGGMTIGWVIALRWVVKDSEDENTDTV